jgi:hypothetical protein
VVEKGPAWIVATDFRITAYESIRERREVACRALAKRLRINEQRKGNIQVIKN